ncbi:hypothetical protein ABPG74_001300 [Tetrahymena malaccensis]
MSSSSPQQNSGYNSQLPLEFKQYLDIQQQLQIFQDPSKLNLQNRVVKENKTEKQIYKQEINQQLINEKQEDNAANQNNSQELIYKTTAQYQNGYREFKEKLREKKRELQELHEKYHQRKQILQQNNDFNQQNSSQERLLSQDQSILLENNQQSFDERSRQYRHRHHQRLNCDNMNKQENSRNSGFQNDPEHTDYNQELNRSHHHHHHHKRFCPFSSNSVEKLNKNEQINQDSQQNNQFKGFQQNDLQQQNQKKITENRFCHFISSKQDVNLNNNNNNTFEQKHQCFFQEKWQSRDQNCRNEFHPIPKLLFAAGIFYLGIKFSRKAIYCMRSYRNRGFDKK